jgi:Rrf2 family protein
VLLSKSCYYGIRASVFVASLEKDSKVEYVPIQQVAKALNISFHFLTKILQTLTEKRIMASYRGPKGGIRLARAAEEVKLIEIVQAIDGSAVFTECILGLTGCGEMAPCPLHGDWGEARKQTKAMFEKTTLAELANKMHEFNLRLAG